MKNLSDLRIAVVGLGYVGLPLAVEFGKKRTTLGFDINFERIEELSSHYDKTLEIKPEEFKQASLLEFTNDENNLKECNCFIITVPTPIDLNKNPDLTYLISASELVGKALSEDSIVIYESTVFPGCTEEICIPVLEEVSGLKYINSKNEADVLSGFYCGYSPERINPGDKLHKLVNIKKVTSGSTERSAELIDMLYAEIIEAGTYKATSIAVAEAAKVIENSQRDLNIAFMNELSIIFNKLGIETKEVLEAASTKWNFLPFTPGLVGGHCIGVDPYYLAYKAKSLGYIPRVILSGRTINDSMGSYIVDKLIELMKRKGLSLLSSKVLILGLTFKENCPDIRNSKVIDIYRKMQEKSIKSDIYDPWVDIKEAKKAYDIDCLETITQTAGYDIAILATAHEEFKSNWEQIKKDLHNPSIVLDLKYCLPINESNFRL